MSVPGFNDPFNPFYDQFSIDADTLTLPIHFDQYAPVNQTDYHCLMVIAPSISKGATKWTLNDKYITIGIYSDEGRAPAQRPLIAGLTWTRFGQVITITDPNGHTLKVGDSINLTNVNISILTNMIVTSVIDAYHFTFNGSVLGATSGSTATYQDNFLTNFRSTRIVFRLLPSFALVPFSTIQQIFIDSAPSPQAAARSIYNVTTAAVVKIPNASSATTNYELPTKVVPKDELLPLSRRFDQVYNEAGLPLSIKYLNSGDSVVVNNVDSPTKNDQIFYNLPVNPTSDPYISVYDYYGVEINDPTRGPFFSTTNVIRDVTIQGDINNIVNTTSDTMLTDSFGNLVIGVQSNNALVVRKQVLPLVVDSFNRPSKALV